MQLMAAHSAAIAALHQAAFPAGEAWQKADFERFLAQESYRAYGLDGARLKSFILVQIGYDRADIISLATDPKHQGQGWAGRLLKWTENKLAAGPVRFWTLDVAADNHRAIKFYTKHGFQTDGIRKNYYRRASGVRVDAYLMSRTFTGH